MTNFQFISPRQIENFSKKLAEIDVNDLGLEKYQTSYLNNLLVHKRYFVSIYAAVLNEVIQFSSKEKQLTFLIDYGAGNGLLGLFAKYCGFGKVVQVDTSSACCLSQKILSKKLDLHIDENINGDYQSLEKFTAHPPDALIATDVIEHIYDLDKFFAALQKMNDQLVTVFTTASNDQNWWKKKKLMRIQKKDEWNDHTNDNDFCESFRTVRSHIIKEKIPEISHTELDRLVTHTRGLRKDDIELACSLYIKNGTILPLLLHPTNTCDPISGSWTERFLTFKQYDRLFNKYGFSLIIKNGFYNDFQKGIKGKILSVLNILIRKMGKKGSALSPFIILTGR